MNKAKEINALHDQAMDLAGQAFQADLQGEYAAAESHYMKAFELERRAALLLADDKDAEPTRSVLLRSAATLGVDCREYREAERLVATALSGNPPFELCEELRDVLETIYFNRHLSARGLELDPGEFQMSLTGGAVGLGVADSAQFLRRADTLEKLTWRTAERMQGLPFRETGSPSKQQLKGFEVYYSVPRPASFAISIRIGRPHRQMLLAGFEHVNPKDIVDELLVCIAIFNAEDVIELHHRIESESYYNNFTALARKLAPDGERITAVGLTSIRGNETNAVALTHAPRQIWRSNPEHAEKVNLVGVLRSANETKRKKEHPVFGIEDEAGTNYTVTVPPGMLQDIVKPYWGERVQVLALRSHNNHYEFVDIDPAEIQSQETVENEPLR